MRTTLFPGLLALLVLASACSKQDHSHEGHSHGQPPPAQSKPAASTAARTSTAAQCAAHSAPKELCFICDPALRDKNRLWCNEHARYEDRCWLCHPELRDAKRLYCEEHGIYEDECFICHPEIKPVPQAATPAPGAAAALMCAEHGVLEAECGICHPELIQSPPRAGVKVRLPSKESIASAGVQLGKPSKASIADGVECYAELAFNQNRVAQIVAPVSGILQEVPVDLGSAVEEKQTVARLWSAGIAEAVAKAVLSHQTLDRERRLRAQRVTSEQNLQEAEAAHRAACQQLRTLGFTEEQIESLGADPQEQVLLEVRAPFSGEIVDRTAVHGALVEAGKPLFTLADRSVMWAMLNVPEAALRGVRVGQKVELRVDSLPGQTFSGKLTWISAEVDDRTRMTRARAELQNPDGVLKAKMFARARILTRNAEQAVVIPASAVQHVEGQTVVFVKLEDDLFEARPVELGARNDDQVEVRAGLKVEDELAVRHVFPLKSQLLVSRLGPGCAHDK